MEVLERDCYQTNQSSGPEPFRLSDCCSKTIRLWCRPGVILRFDPCVISSFRSSSSLSYVFALLTELVAWLWHHGLPGYQGWPNAIDGWERFHHKNLGSNYREFFVKAFAKADDEILLLVICFVRARAGYHGAIVVEFFPDWFMFSEIVSYWL